MFRWRLVFEICAVSLPLDLQRLMFPSCSERQPSSLGFPGLSPSCSHTFSNHETFSCIVKIPLKTQIYVVVLSETSSPSSPPPTPDLQLLSFYLNSPRTVACLSVTSVQHIAAHPGVAEVLARIYS